MTREDAIKHLENMKWLLGVNNTTVDDIPLTKVIDDIAALLKAQEPRVMTLEEAQGEDYCWYESRVANICVLCDATMYPNPNGKPKTELQQMGKWMRGWQYDDDYGKRWRCWTSRPDEKRREETPWN